MTTTTTDLASALEAAAGRLDEAGVEIRYDPIARRWVGRCGDPSLGGGTFAGRCPRGVIEAMVEHMTRGTYS